MTAIHCFYCLFVCLSVSVSLSASVIMFLCLCHFVPVPVSDTVSVSLSLSDTVTVTVSVTLSLSLSLSLSCLCRAQVLMFNGSKKESHHPSSGFKKLYRRLKGTYKVQLYVQACRSSVVCVCFCLLSFPHCFSFLLSLSPHTATKTSCP